jgi:hypothetical protein
MNTGFSLWELTNREFPVSLTGFGFAVWLIHFTMRDSLPPNFCAVCIQNRLTNKSRLGHMGVHILSRILIFGPIFKIFRICIVVARGATGKYKVVVSARETSLTFQD